MDQTTDNNPPLEGPGSPQTILIERLRHVWQIVGLWPSIAMIAGADGKGFDAAGLLANMCNALSQGAVFVCFVRGEFAGYSVVEKVGQIVVIHSLPKDTGIGLGKVTIQVIKRWAFENGMKELQITLNSTTGSGHSYVRKSLGFRRKAETFAMNV